MGWREVSFKEVARHRMSNGKDLCIQMRGDGEYMVVFNTENGGDGYWVHLDFIRLWCGRGNGVDLETATAFFMAKMAEDLGKLS